jgi:RNA polymerase sigma-70 factor (ECF subfamily)
MPIAQTKDKARVVFFTDGMSEPGRHAGGTELPRCPADAHEVVTAAYDRYADELYRYALMLTAEHGTAEDAMQQAFLKLTHMGTRVLKIESCAHYLRTVVRNECWRLLDKRRRRRREVELTEARPLVAPVSGSRVDEDERRELEAALRALPPEQREVVHLKVYEEKTFQQIGDLLGISINTAASRYRYAIDRLRGLLAPRPGP